jgi:hypothetical protein
LACLDVTHHKIVVCNLADALPAVEAVAICAINDIELKDEGCHQMTPLLLSDNVIPFHVFT